MPENTPRDLRARLLDGALAIVDEHGAAGLTVRAVAKAAGCSTMGVYTHYQGKSGLIDAVVEWGFDALDRDMEAAFQDAGCGREGLLATGAVLRDWALAHPTHFQAMFVAGVPGYHPSRETRDRTWETFYAHRARVANALDSADADPERFQQAAMDLWACVHGHVSIELLQRAYDPQRETGRDFDAALRNALVAITLAAADAGASAR